MRPQRCAPLGFLGRLPEALTHSATEWRFVEHQPRGITLALPPALMPKFSGIKRLLTCGHSLAGIRAMYKTKSAQIERPGVLLHGWDAQAESWHGPIPLVPTKSGSRTTSKVRTAPGAFQGKLRCSVPGLPCIEFYTAIYDLRDTAVAIVHMDGSHGGPVGILAVIPHDRRKLMRDDFAFELMTLISFLGAPVNSGCELQINDYMEEALRVEPLATQVFAVETAALSWDAEHRAVGAFREPGRCDAGLDGW